MPTQDDSRRVMKPYEHVNSAGRPSLCLDDRQIRESIHRVMPELMEHHLDALVPNCRLAVDVLVEPGSTVPMWDAMGVLSGTRYWSALGRGLRRFDDSILLHLLVKGLLPLVERVKRWREGEGKLPS